MLYNGERYNLLNDKLVKSFTAKFHFFCTFHSDKSHIDDIRKFYYFIYTFVACRKVPFSGALYQLPMTHICCQELVRD